MTREEAAKILQTLIEMAMGAEIADDVDKALEVAVRALREKREEILEPREGVPVGEWRVPKREDRNDELEESRKSRGDRGGSRLRATVLPDGEQRLAAPQPRRQD